MESETVMAKDKFKGISLSMRPKLSLYYISPVVTAFILAGNYDIRKIFLMSLSVLFIMFMGNTLNFIYTSEWDKLHPMANSENPYNIGFLTRREMWFLVFAFFTGSFLAAIPIGLYWSLMILFGNFLSITYDPKPFRLKGKLYGWFISVGPTSALVFLFSYAIATSSLNYSASILLSAIFYYLTFIMIIFKDIPDIKADMAGNYRTFPVAFGIDASRYLVIICNLAATLVYLILTVFGIQSILGLPFVVFTAVSTFRVMTRPVEKLMDREWLYSHLIPATIILVSIFMFGSVLKILVGY